MVAIVKPLEVNTMVNRPRVKVVMILIVTLFVIGDGEVSFSSANGSNNLNTKKVDYHNLPPKILSLVDMAGLLMGSFLPFGIVLTLNAIKASANKIKSLVSLI